MIELYNTTSQAVSVGGWYLSDSSTNLAMYQIAAGTSIAARGYLVLTDARNYGPGSGDPGGDDTLRPQQVRLHRLPVVRRARLARRGRRLPGRGNLWCHSPGHLGRLGHDLDGRSGLRAPCNSQLRAGSERRLSGAANSLAYVSPIVMTELQYDPAEPTAAESAAGYTDGDDFEYLELYNRSSTTQTLNDYYMGNGVGFSFGWVADSTANESETLESGATATWTTSGLAAGTYTVYADYDLTDPDGNARTVDGSAQYTITYPGVRPPLPPIRARPSMASSTWARSPPPARARYGPTPAAIDGSPKPMDVGQPGGVRQLGRRREGGQPRADLLRHHQRPYHAAPGAYVLLVSDLRGIRLPLWLRHPGGRPIHGPPEQRRRADDPR